MRVGSATAGPTGDGERSDGGVPCAIAFCHCCRYQAGRGSNRRALVARRVLRTDVHCAYSCRRDAAESSGSGGMPLAAFAGTAGLGG
jgi:hypothetical protein